MKNMKWNKDKKHHFVPAGHSLMGLQRKMIHNVFKDNMLDPPWV